MPTHHVVGEWHLEITLVQGVLRRYTGQDPSAAFEARAPFDAVMNVELRDGHAKFSAALAKPPKFTKADHRAIEALVRALGAERLRASRHGAERDLPYASP
jgi:hypothetical protein